MYLPMMGASSRFGLLRHVLRPGDDGRGQRILAGAGRAPRQAADRFGDRLLRRHRILHQVRDDQIDRHRVVIRVPAVVVGDEREGRVADLRLARELCLLQVRHADDVHPPRSIEPRLGQRRELRPFHVHVGAAAVHGRADRSRRRSAAIADKSLQTGCVLLYVHLYNIHLQSKVHEWPILPLFYRPKGASPCSFTIRTSRPGIGNPCSARISIFLIYCQIGPSQT